MCTLTVVFLRPAHEPSRKKIVWLFVVKVLGRNSSVGIATRYGLGGTGIESR